MTHFTDSGAAVEKPGQADFAPANGRTRRAAFVVLAAGLAAALAGCRTVVRPPSGLNFDFDENEDRAGGGGV